MPRLVVLPGTLWVGEAAPANRAAWETERRHDGEARFPSSDGKAGCLERMSGEMARTASATSEQPTRIPDGPKCQATSIIPRVGMDDETYRKG